MLSEIAESSVAVAKSGDDVIIEVPKREQALDEQVRKWGMGHFPGLPKLSGVNCKYMSVL